jgi:hypothetical protein
MSKLYFGTVAAVLVGAGSAMAETASKAPFVQGSSTVAEVEENLGAPFDTSMQPDGALTLVYPASRVPGLKYGKSAAGRTVTLHFGADFILRDATVTRAGLLARDGFASR